jgi:hypothetical protein
MEIHQRFRAGPDAPALGRGALGGLERVMPRGPLEDARLLVSELVTASSRAGDGDEEPASRPRRHFAVLHARFSDEELRVEVEDLGAGVDDPWGRRLMERLSDRWGVDPDRGRAWFVLEV